MAACVSSELSTAVKYGINVVTIVFRNDSCGNVARDLTDFFGGAYETDLHNPDFVKLPSPSAQSISGLMTP